MHLGAQLIKKILIGKLDKLEFFLKVVRAALCDIIGENKLLPDTSWRQLISRDQRIGNDKILVDREVPQLPLFAHSYSQKSDKNE